jgi:TonB family protein
LALGYRIEGLFMKSLMLLAALMLGVPAGGAAPSTATIPTELLPSGKWQVEYAKSSCIINRAFGEGAQRTIFALKSAPYSDTTRMLIIVPSAAGRGSQGDAKVTFSGGYVPKYAYYASVTAAGTRVTSIDLPRETLDSLAKGDGVAIKAGKLVNLGLRPTGFDKVMEALDDCESDLLASWGFDKAAQATVATRPKGLLRSVFQSSDYPDKELTEGIGGTAGVRLRIETNGKVSECVVVEPSGAPGLDKQTCAVAKKRGRYSPALGHDGKPLWSFTFERITWMVMDY